jgi:pentatricopeptide repeat protein
MEASLYARNIINYHTLIDGFCKKNKNLAEAKEIFDQIELHGVSRNSWPLLKRENERGLLN